MASSPLSAPATPRTATPLPSEEDLARSNPPPQDAAHTMATQGEADVEWGSPAATSVGSAPPSGDTMTVPAPVPKGKEKAAKAPLRLLDLPMDILKEIIHQVRATPHITASCYEPWLIMTPPASTYERPHIPLSLPLSPPPAHHTMHLFALRHRVARREHAHRAAIRRRCAHLWPGHAGHG